MNNIKFIPSDLIEICKHSSTGFIKIYNSSEEKRAFKIKTTKPKDYLVKPSLGILYPNQDVVIEIKLLEGSEIDISHKFIVEIYNINWKQKEDNLKEYLKSSNVNPYTIQRFEVKPNSKNVSEIKQKNDSNMFYFCVLYICFVWCLIIYNIMKNNLI